MDSDGTLNYGQGATGATNPGMGTYTVTFNQSLTGCVAIGNLGAGSSTDGIWAMET